MKPMIYTAAALVAASMPAVHAQSVAASQTEEVIVVGTIIAGEKRALDAQRESDRIVNVVSADGIGKLPDRNAAEAVQRVPGLSIERDQGEGRFVAVRGLPSQWSSASVNGDRLPTAEEETTSRATAFDFFPSEMIERVVVTKSVTPDLEGDAIGGNVDFVTRTAPDEYTLQTSLGYTYDEKAGSGGYAASALWGNRGEKFGFLLNATSWERDWATDNYEPRRGDDGLGIYRLELRDYTGTRKTQGLNGAVEYTLDSGAKLFARGLYGALEDDETHFKHRYRFDANRVELQHIFNILNTEFTGFQIGGNHTLGAALALDWRLSTYENHFFYGDVPNGTDNSYFVARFDQRNVGYVGLENRGTGQNLAYNTVDGGNDPRDAISTHLPATYRPDPTVTRLSSIELYKIDVREQDRVVAQTDLTYEATDALQLEFGAKYRDKERSAHFADEFYTWNATLAGRPAPTLAEFQLRNQPGRSDYLDGEANRRYDQDFLQVASRQQMVNLWNQNRQFFALDAAGSALVANGGALGRDFDVLEKHVAGYAMATYALNDRVTLVGGLRLENTDTEVDGLVYLEESNSLQPAHADKSYLSWLPSLSVKYAATQRTNYRFALTRTFARPDFGSLSPGGSFIEADNRFFSGNPDLDPTYAWNADAMVEHYFDTIGIVSAGVFYKKITDPIFQDSTIGSFNGASGVVLVRPENGDDAWLAGAELTFNRRLEFLGDWARNLGFIGNATFMDSKMRIPGRTDEVPIPRQADTLYNATLYYDDGRFAARLAVNHKDAYVQEHGSEKTFDLFYGAYTALDLSVSFQFTDHLLAYLEANNLTDEPLVYYFGTKDRPAQVEYYGIRGQFGVKYAF